MFKDVLYVTILLLSKGYCQHPACESGIFCRGKILDAVQKAMVFKDSKTFVDMNLKTEPDLVQQAFDQLPPELARVKVADFVLKYFEGPGTDLEPAHLNDWNPEPGIVRRVRDPYLRDWVKDLNILWKKLAKKTKSAVKHHQDRYSIMYQEHPFIVPGGRFREMHYWNMYWTVRGLLISEMTETVHGILTDMLTLVERFGYMPQGGRIYQTGRSNPPMLVSMVAEYVRVTNDISFLHKHLPTLEKEYNWWRNHRSVVLDKDGQIYTLNQYNVQLSDPRPEAYREDTYLSSLVRASQRREDIEIFSDVVSAVESGMDFSARWFSVNRFDVAMDDIATRNVVPVDLNAILCMNELKMARFYEQVGNQQKKEEFLAAAAKRRKAIREVFWNDDFGFWFDYDRNTSNTNSLLYPINILPLVANCAGSDPEDDQAILLRVFTILKKWGYLSYPGGVPISILKYRNPEQWDWPNSSPTVTEIVIDALSRSIDQQVQNYTFDVANSFINSTFRTWEKEHVMYDRYDARTQGRPGSMGEYPAQTGFDWTNSVVMIIMDKYSDDLDTGRPSSAVAMETSTLLPYVCLLIIMSIFDYSKS